MMEPVAYTSQHLLDEVARGFIGSIYPKRTVRPETEVPLVRLSDAEARIAELEELAKAFEAEANQMREVSIKNRHRAEAAEALLKEAGKALEPFADVATEHDEESDGQQVWPTFTIGDFRAARAIHHKIGVKDE